MLTISFKVFFWILIFLSVGVLNNKYNQNQEFATIEKCNINERKQKRKLSNDFHFIRNKEKYLFSLNLMDSISFVIESGKKILTITRISEGRGNKNTVYYLTNRQK